MEEFQSFQQLDSLTLDKRLREKMYELQYTANALDSMQKQYQQTLHTVQSMQSLLENERRISNDLQTQLNVSINAVKHLEEERTKNRMTTIEFQIKYESVLNERESLIKRANAAKIEALEYKIKLKNLEDQIRREKVLNKELQELFNNGTQQCSQIMQTINDDIAKLKSQMKCLEKNCESANLLNQRLQTVGLCTYTIHQKDKLKIEDLERRLVSLLADSDKVSCCNTVLHPEVENLRTKLDAALKELKERQNDDNMMM